MKIHHLTIENFRGVSNLSWAVRSSMVCLIGPGNSTKTTILDAIYYVLYPSWNLVFTDSDFHNTDTNNPIRIAVTIGELPPPLINHSKYSECYGGIDADGLLKVEPSDEDDLIFTIELVVDSTLEPKWNFISNRISDERNISYRDRERLGVFRLGSFLDREFSWNRGTSLSRITTDESEITKVLAQVSREARGAVLDGHFVNLKETANKVTDIAKRFSFGSKELKPAIDTQVSGVISLHEDEVPVRLSGLGARRLLAIGIQHEAVSSGSILLVDEIEHGLEPHRLRNLIHQVNPQKTPGQTFITTHSPVAISELQRDELHIVHNRSGSVEIKSLPENIGIERTIKRASEALLGDKLIVCEGVTEREFCKALDPYFQDEGLDSFSYKGVATILPEGAGRLQSPKTAKALSDIGYKTVYFGDSDKPIEPSKEELEAAGVKAILWSDSLCIEERVFRDLTWEGIVELVSRYIEKSASYKEIEGIAKQEAISGVLNTLGQKILTIDSNKERGKGILNSLRSPDTNYRKEINSWKANYDESVIRELLGAISISKKNPWFKSSENAELFSCTVMKFLKVTDQSTDLVQKVNLLRSWIYD